MAQTKTMPSQAICPSCGELRSPNAFYIDGLGGVCDTCATEVALNPEVRPQGFRTPTAPNVAPRDQRLGVAAPRG